MWEEQYASAPVLVIPITIFNIKYSLNNPAGETNTGISSQIPLNSASHAWCIFVEAHNVHQGISARSFCTLARNSTTQNNTKQIIHSLQYTVSARKRYRVTEENRATMLRRQACIHCCNCSLIIVYIQLQYSLNNPGLESRKTYPGAAQTSWVRIGI